MPYIEPESSLEAWLTERYTAFTHVHESGRLRFFGVWHPPWRRKPVQVDILDRSLLTAGLGWQAQGSSGPAGHPGFRMFG